MDNTVNGTAGSDGGGFTTGVDVGGSVDSEEGAGAGFGSVEGNGSVVCGRPETGVSIGSSVCSGSCAAAGVGVAGNSVSAVLCLHPGIIAVMRIHAANIKSIRLSIFSYPWFRLSFSLGRSSGIDIKYNTVKV
jgi:hypothetical protein